VAEFIAKLKQPLPIPEPPKKDSDQKNNEIENPEHESN
jgi:hypothetical protein